MRRRTAGLVLIGLAAACLAAPAHSEEEDKLLPPPGTRAFGFRLQRLPLAGQKGEPGILNRAGLTVVNTFGPTIWTSADHGKHWILNKAKDIEITGCPSGDADHTILADGTILADNLCLAGPTNLIYRSTDKGKTFVPGGPAGLVPGEAGTLSDRQWLAADPKDPKVVYMSFHDIAGPNIWLLKSIDGGVTFPVRVPISVFSPTAFAEASGGNTTARPVIDPTNTQVLYIAYSFTDVVTGYTGLPTEPDFSPTKIGVAKSIDGGLTWNTVIAYDSLGEARIAHLFADMAVDAAGNLYVVFSSRTLPGKKTEVKMVTSSDHGATWSKAIEVSQPVNGSNVMPAIAAPRPGWVNVVYYATREGDFDSKAGEWAIEFAQSRNALAGRPKFDRTRLGGTSHYRDICMSGTLCAVTGGNRNLSDFIGITTDPRGFAQVVWTEDAEVGSILYAEQTAQPKR